MKRLVKILLVILFVGVTVGCEKHVSKATYATFNEYFLNKDGFSISDDTDGYDIEVRRHIQAVSKNYQIYFVEYDSEKSANKYINELKKESGYTIKEYDKYTYVEYTKGKYVVMYKVDETIVMGMSNDTGYKSEINGILKDLGY